MMEQERCGVVILGSTGSIGMQALDVIKAHKDQFYVAGIAARNEAELIREQIREYRPGAVSVSDPQTYSRIKQDLPDGVELMTGLDGMKSLVSLPQADTILVAVSGAVGIEPTLEAIAAGKRVALANKETLVAAGDLVMNRVREKGIMLLPVDSEHSAIFQCLAGEERHLKQIWLTASGGPFRDCTERQMQEVTVEKTLHHPTWKMGPKITVDSATLMNKGLEVIEAHHLFAVDYDHIQVVVHRESIVHSLVELVDGSYLAHLGPHDMRIPIQYALTYPNRFVSPAESLDLAALGRLHFEEPDGKRFPALPMAYAAGRMGGTMPAVLNAANEEAVQAFLAHQIRFTDIAGFVSGVMDLHETWPASDVDAILEADRWARLRCRELIAAKQGS